MRILAIILLSPLLMALRAETFSWRQPSPVETCVAVTWEVDCGTNGNTLGTVVSLDSPSVGADGVQTYGPVDLALPADQLIYCAARAICADGTESVNSNVIQRAAQVPPTTSAPNPPIVTANGYVVSATYSTTGAAATSAWFSVYVPGVAAPVRISGGAFPRSIDLTTDFTANPSATRLEVEACAENSTGYACAVRISVPRTPAPVKPGKPKKPRPGQQAADWPMYTLRAPWFVCTEGDPVATSYVWDNPATAVDEAIVTTKPTLPLTNLGSYQMTVRGRNSAGDGPKSDPSDMLQVVNSSGADLDGNIDVNRHDFVSIFLPAFWAGARSCANGSCGVCP